MTIYEWQGHKCISINGKDYFLIRAYGIGWDKFILIQVSGRTPLKKEDLPTKDWEVLASKVGDSRVWTAYHKGYFAYETERQDPALAFLGATTEGSYYLALRYLAEKFRIAVNDLHRAAHLYATGQARSCYLKRCQDLGNSGEDLVLLEFDSYLDADEASRILKGG